MLQEAMKEQEKALKSHLNSLNKRQMDEYN
jgi:hypothetical protein